MFYDYNLRIRNFTYDNNDYIKYAKKLEIEKIDQLLYEIELMLKNE